MISNDNSDSLHPACASCKHQRRKCKPDCPLAPFFPAEKTHLFQAVQKVFGVSNVMKLIKSLETHEQKQIAATTMCWEAHWRLKNPVEGCYSEVRRLSAELDLYKQAFIERQAYTVVAAKAGYSGAMIVSPHEMMNASVYGNNNIMNNSGISNINAGDMNQGSFVYGFSKENHNGDHILHQNMPGANNQPNYSDHRGDHVLYQNKPSDLHQQIFANHRNEQIVYQNMSGDVIQQSCSKHCGDQTLYQNMPGQVNQQNYSNNRNDQIIYQNMPRNANKQNYS